MGYEVNARNFVKHEVIFARRNGDGILDWVPAWFEIRKAYLQWIAIGYGATEIDWDDERECYYFAVYEIRNQQGPKMCV